MSENKKKENKTKVEEKIEKVEPVKPKKRSLTLYFLGMLGIFILIDVAISVICSDLVELVSYNKYGSDMVLEIFYAILVLIVMLLFKNAYVFTSKKEKLFKSLFLASPMLIFSTVVLFQNIFDLDTVKLAESGFGNLINVALFSVFIGITEEFLCRGWLQNEFLERFGESRKNVILSIVLSSFIFGIMHIVNIITTPQTLFETVLQIINAMSLGFLLGSLYYKTKNIWSVIILHAYYDFAIMLGDINTVKDCTYGTLTNNIFIFSTLAVLILGLFWILCSLLIIKKTNYPDVRAAQGKQTRFYSTVIPLIAISFVLSLVPYESLIEDYDDYYICYSYNEMKIDKNFTIHYPHYDRYNISQDKSTNSFIIEGEEVQEVTTLNNYNYDVYVKSGEAVIKNNNTGTEKVLFDGLVESVVVVERKAGYTIILDTIENGFDQAIYVSNVMEKEELSNSDDYLNMLAESFRKIELPNITISGYITIENENDYYPTFVSNNNDVFILKNDDLYLIK